MVQHSFFGSRLVGQNRMWQVGNFLWLAPVLFVPFSALTLLVGRQEENAACMNLLQRCPRCCSGGLGRA